ncbi:MAG: 50S ribosomal protein L28 [Chlamydiales bacterium]
MPRRCQVTGKVPMKGRSYALRGIAKKKKGVGLKVTGIKKRRFNPNLLKKRFWFGEEKRFVTLTLSAHGMRTIDKRGLNAVIQEMRAAGEKI